MDDITRQTWQRLREERQRLSRRFAEVIRGLEALGETELTVPVALLEELKAAAQPQLATQPGPQPHQLRV